MLKLTKIAASGLSGLVLFLSIGQPAQAGPFDEINRTIQGVNGTIRDFRGTVENTGATVNSLRSLLGTPGSGSNSENSSRQSQQQSNSAPALDAADMNEVFALYRNWYTAMPTSDRTVVAQLVTAYASGSRPSFSSFSANDWFQQMPLQQQQRAGELFFKFQKIMDTVGNQRDSFLAYAFCVNSGSQSCEP